MRRTKAILFEGVPGSGKSTSAHFIARQLANRDVSAKWWYEEEAGNPLMIFDDLGSLRRVQDDLISGNHRSVVSAVIERWRRFAEARQRAPEMVLLDSCLFGYLTWSLFPTDVPPAEISAYLDEVERIVAPLDPCLIYFRQRDVGASLRRLLDRRGRILEERYIARTCESAYGRRQGLQGFEGLAAFWSAYRNFSDGAFAAIGFAKLAVETDSGDWSSYHRQMLDFLDLPSIAEEAVSPDALARFAGAYRYRDESGEGRCVVTLEDGALYLDGAPHVWPHTRLVPIPKAIRVFEVESFPFEVAFSADSPGAITTMTMRGPETAFQQVNCTFRKEAFAAEPTVAE